MVGYVEFKDEDQDDDGMSVGPACIVTPNDRQPIGQDVSWYRRDVVEKWAAERGYEVREA